MIQFTSLREEGPAALSPGGEGGGEGVFVVQALDTSGRLGLVDVTSDGAKHGIRPFYRKRGAAEQRRRAMGNARPHDERAAHRPPNGPTRARATSRGGRSGAAGGRAGGRDGKTAPPPPRVPHAERRMGRAPVSRTPRKRPSDCPAVPHAPPPPHAPSDTPAPRAAVAHGMGSDVRAPPGGWGPRGPIGYSAGGPEGGTARRRRRWGGDLGLRPWHQRNAVGRPPRPTRTALNWGPMDKQIAKKKMWVAPNATEKFASNVDGIGPLGPSMCSVHLKRNCGKDPRNGESKSTCPITKRRMGPNGGLGGGQGTRDARETRAAGAERQDSNTKASPGTLSAMRFGELGRPVSTGPRPPRDPCV